MGGSDPTAVLGGRYELQELVGLGGAAEVYRARDARLDLTVAIKVFLTGASGPDQHRQRQEVELLTGLAHPGLVGLRDAGGERGHAWLVMDFVAGATLAERLRGGPMPPADVAKLGADLAAALDYVHRHDVVHRDIKPANILLDANDAPRLTDFGISRLVDATRVTATGFLMGTPAYLAPEQVLGEHIGTAADVYALGLVLLECLTGQREYPGGAVETALARLHRAPAIPDWVPLPLRRLLSEMTARNPGERPSAGYVAALLDTPQITATDPTAPRTLPLASGRGPREQAVSGLHPPSPHPAGRTSQWHVLGGLAAAAATGLVAVVPGVGTFGGESGAAGTAVPPSPTGTPPAPTAEQRPSSERGSAPPAASPDQAHPDRGRGSGERIHVHHRTERITIVRGQESEPEATRASEPDEKSGSEQPQTSEQRQTSEQPQTSEPTETSERDETQVPERTQTSEKTERSERTETSEQTQEPEQTETSEQAETSEQSQESEPQQTDQAE